MDIFNRPPAISEDTLQYTLYPTLELSDKASVTTLAVLMQSYVDSMLPEMQWHRDAFQLKVSTNPDGDGFVLEGTMRVGDCVDDEWCAVWLLREISAKWDVAVRVFDSDGEFLLIEAADHLPAWVTPSNAENRVWIYNSHLHLVPLSHISAPSSKERRRGYPRAHADEDEIEQPDEEDFITASDAIKLLRDSLADTRASQDVENAVWHRIMGYPGAARAHVHYTKTYLPVDVAKALAVNPGLVQKAIETFYTRDALQLRAAHRMSRFPPEPSVPTTVRMTRTAYAQLVGQKFYPPKIFPRWSEAEGTSEWRWRDVGMKIVSSQLYNLLAYDLQTFRGEFAGGSKIIPKLEARKEALQRNPDYQKYIENLTSSGYFKGELEGSQLWNELADRAANAFVEARRDDDTNRPSFASQADAAAVKGNLASTRDLPEDSDEWLNVTAEDFDAMLEKSTGKSQSKVEQSSDEAMDVDTDGNIEEEEEKVAREQASRLKDLAKKVEDFVEGKGDVEGAVFEDEVLSDGELGEDSDDSDDMATSDEDEDEDVQQVTRKEAMDRLVPGIDPSEYGKMPATFHSNSQRVAPTTVETEIREEKPEEGSDNQPYMRPIRPPILPRDEYEGVVDSDDETDEEGEGGGEDEESDEDKPQVVGEVEIDMEEEQDEFLEFARHALGVSDEQWNEIVKDRQSRGAFVPAKGTIPINNPKKTTSPSNPPTEHSRVPRVPAPGPRPNVNPNLDSFEAVMQAMDAELARNRSATAQTPSAKTDKGKGKMQATEAGEDDEEDIEAAMEAELKDVLDKGFDEDDAEIGGGEHMDYNLIKNFLESFRSQAGLSGPVSNLAGRLQGGWALPRDES
ncbi:hypothetical protein EW026_g363 [Hermanssonia centrifuga]|uniref:SGT1-domain-containing protein n=1 Tax=Hermanssonia centrifuga TaxID=98765 RepID=A0A4V3XBM0_9APHY|nr:hypothetical protein EW026_g363 [Hermanssonia centrifuga]